MAARRAERLVNLVICLLSTRQYLTAERIRQAVPGYETSDGTDEAFKRMFERDKAELRELGMPLETGRNSVFDTDDGYRIVRGSYELPPIEFDPAEAAAVAIASRLWQSATLADAARSALNKLKAGGAELTTSSLTDEPPMDAADPALPILIEAARRAQVVQFDYLKLGESEPTTRTVEPWGVLSWRGRWYLVGYDRDRQTPRSFRLSRFASEATPTGRAGAFERPAEVNLLDYVARRPPETQRVATVHVVAGAAAGLRRMAHEDADGALSIRFTDAEELARFVAGAGAAAKAIEPADLVAAVRRRLQAAAELGLEVNR
jgi:proteasome accessory factor B